MTFLKESEEKERIRSINMEGVSEDIVSAAEESAKAYVQGLRISSRSDRFVKVLEDSSIDQVLIFLSSAIDHIGFRLFFVLLF
mmetsp:Transcript_26958/g.31795  ORF Transcript_26958/g.31795 Transcript_26958/m.31795 type:complete len:83 (+) Transcript_26958:786-1034(+)